ncbi:hypothetical protein F750_7118 (plasmid) [Streptomyces sp. PAMC 26508]|nr:hypothetical protein F750_7118 [Streptomyces sp. PAMC 26508]
MAPVSPRPLTMPRLAVAQPIGGRRAGVLERDTHPVGLVRTTLQN